MQPRCVVRVQVDKIRVGVVLQTDGERLRVITGTSQEHRELHPVTVHETGRQGRIMQLRETTFFHGRDAYWVTREKIIEMLRPCSNELFLELSAIVDEWDRR